MALPDVSSTPLTVAVYVVNGFRAAYGVSVAVLVPALNVSVPGTFALLGSFSTSATDAPWTGFVNVALTTVLGAIAVAPFAGFVERTVGGEASVVNTTSTQ